MKHTVSIMTISLLFFLVGCTSKNDAVQPKDWDNTTYLISSDDEQSCQTYYKPYCGYIGDVMPMYDIKTQSFKIYYLQDYRPNPAGTYHPIWGLSYTADKGYINDGEVIPCGGLQEQDAAIGTGSCFWSEQQQKYYFFYTGNKYFPSAEDNGQAVQYATSTDGKTWIKNSVFVLRGDDYGYSNNDFRDPFVFQDDDNLYHMIVSTTTGKGTLAEFTSTDLQTWTHKGAFMTMMWDRFYECPDVFKMGDWWYLVYSEQHKAIRKVQYFKGRTLEELKACTANDAGKWPDDHEGYLDSRGFYAGKTASDGQNRYIWGWCPTRKGNDNTATGSDKEEPEWAGSLIMHRVIQHEDGSLSLGKVPAIDAKYTTVVPLKVMRIQGEAAAKDQYTLSGESNILFNRLGRHNHLHMVVTTAGAEDNFGISLCRGTSMVSDADSSVYYTIVVNPENATQRKINFEQRGEGGIGFVGYIDGYTFATPTNNIYSIDIYTDNSICVMYINDNVCWTNRIHGIQKNCWSLDCLSGSITVTDVSVTQY